MGEPGLLEADHSSLFYETQQIARAASTGHWLGSICSAFAAKQLRLRTVERTERQPEEFVFEAATAFFVATARLKPRSR